jgi:DNA invertase Pin-like site-specific DNA recombinase
VFIFNIEAAIGQDERDVIVERTQRGKRTKLLGGRLSPIVHRRKPERFCDSLH